MSFLQAVREAVRAAREDSRCDALKCTKYVRSRGTYLSAQDGQLVNAAECYDWRGSLRELNEFLAKVTAQNGGKAPSNICIEGGHDAYETFRDLLDGQDNYEPWAGSWSVTVYKDGVWAVVP